MNGTKTWISNGLHGDVFAVLARTDPAADPPRRGLSMFVMEKGAGFTASRRLHKLGYKGIDAAELVFSDFSVPAGNLIGDEGQGFYLAVSGLELGRINVAARGVGIARRALDEALRYAQQRATFGKPICEHQAIQLKLGEMATRTEAARLLDRGGGRRLRPGGPVRPRGRHGQVLRQRSGHGERHARRCGSTAATATRKSSPSSGSTATPPCSASARAPTRCSGSSSPASWSNGTGSREARPMKLAGVKVVDLSLFLPARTSR